METLGGPFTLRAHHIQLVMLAETSFSPEVVSNRLVTDIEKGRGDATSETVHLEAEEMDFQAYGVDVLGDTITQKQRYRQGVLDTLIQFQQLSDDAPVRLTAGTLDSICKGCAFGVHCTRPENKEHDLRILDYVVEIATEVNLLDDIKISPTEDGAIPEWFDTNAGTVRAIMRCMQYGYVYDKEGKASPAPFDLAP